MKKILVTVFVFSLMLGSMYGAGTKEKPAKTNNAAVNAAEGTQICSGVPKHSLLVL